MAPIFAAFHDSHYCEPFKNKLDDFSSHVTQQGTFSVIRTAVGSTSHQGNWDIWTRYVREKVKKSDGTCCAAEVITTDCRINWTCFYFMTCISVGIIFFSKEFLKSWYLCCPYCDVGFSVWALFMSQDGRHECMWHLVLWTTKFTLKKSISTNSFYWWWPP